MKVPEIVLMVQPNVSGNKISHYPHMFRQASYYMMVELSSVHVDRRVSN